MFLLGIPAADAEFEAATESKRGIDAGPHLEVSADRMGGLLERSGEGGMMRS